MHLQSKCYYECPHRRGGEGCVGCISPPELGVGCTGNAGIEYPLLGMGGGNAGIEYPLLGMGGGNAGIEYPPPEGGPAGPIGILGKGLLSILVVSTTGRRLLASTLPSPASTTTE